MVSCNLHVKSETEKEDKAFSICCRDGVVNFLPRHLQLKQLGWSARIWHERAPY